MAYPIKTQCAEKDCYRPPAGHSYFCHLHKIHMYRTGDPNGRLIPKHVAKGYIEEIEPILERHIDHPAVVSALSYIEDLIEGRGRSSREELEYLARVRDQGVTPKEVLLWLLATWGANVYHKLSDGPALSANIGNAFFRLGGPRRRGRKPCGHLRYLRLNPTIFKPFGRRVRDMLGPLMDRLWTIYESEYRHNLKLRYALSPKAIADLGADRLNLGQEKETGADRRLPSGKDGDGDGA